MDDIELLNIISRWNFWGAEIDVGIKRQTYSNRIKELLDGNNNIVAETGIRRCGKSFIAKQVAKLFISEGYGKENVLIINLEDERFLERDYRLLLNIFDVYKKEVKPTRRPLIIIDEAQEVSGWERFVRGMGERNEALFIITGSSSALLSSEYSTLLSGRHIAINIMPLSFPEFAKFKGLSVDTRLETAKNLDGLRHLFDEYLHYGGMPAVELSENKEDLLSSYFNTVLLKDIAERYRIRDMEKLRFLAKFYLTNISSSITFTRISKATKGERAKGIPVKTVQRFSDYLASSYLFFFVKRFSFSIKDQENSPRKVYAVDNGFASAIGFNFMDIRGRLLENVVACELLRMTHRNGRVEVYYWKSKASRREVDFVLKEGNAITLIQVAYNPSNLETRDREIKGITECAKALRVKKGTIITYNYRASETVGEVKINYVPIVEWILEYELSEGTLEGNHAA